MKHDNRSIKEHLFNRENQNKKPFRTKTQKAEAKRLARIVDGHWVSSAPVSKHSIRS